MTTVREEIKHIAGYYLEQPTNTLSEKDYLVALARTYSFRGCDELKCGLEIHRRDKAMIAKNPDEFIEDQLPAGTVRRREAERATRQLLSIARKYSDSSEEYSMNSGYGRELDIVETAFLKACN